MNPEEIAAQARLWPSVARLLRLRLLITYNNIRRANTRRKIWYAVLALLVVAALVGIFLFSWAMLGLLRRPEVAQVVSVGSLLEAAPTWILTAAFFGLLITSFGVMLQSLYLTGDMEFLLATPTPLRAVFIAKLVEAILPDFGLVCLFGLPALFGLGVANGYTLVYYPLVVLALAALAMASAGLSSLLVMLVVRIFPARRVAELLGFIGAIISVLCSQSGQLTGEVRVGQDQLANLANRLSGLSAPWSPFAWAGGGLVNLGQGRWLSGLGLSALYLALTGGIFFLALITAEHLYYTGWARVQVGSRRKSRRPVQAAPASRSASPLASWLGERISPQVRAIIWKDLRTLTRDLRNVSQLITPLLFGVIYAVTIARGGAFGRGEAPAAFNLAVRMILVDANVGLSLFIGWSLISRLGLMGFSQEGKQFWILKSAPVSPGRMLWAKFWVAYLLPVGLGSLFLALISIVQRAAPATVIYGLVVILFSLAGAVGVNLAFGVSGANFNWQNPRRMVQGTAGCLASLVSMGYMVLIIALFFGPPILVGVFGGPAWLGQLGGLVLGIPTSLACAVFPPMAVRSRIPHMGEE